MKTDHNSSMKTEDRNDLMLTQQVQAVLSVGENDIPVSARLSVRQPLCCCAPWLSYSHRVTTFMFKGEERTSLAADVDVAKLARISEGHPEAMARIKLWLRGQRHGVVTSLTLEELLHGLTRGCPVQMGRLLLRLLPVAEGQQVITHGQDREKPPVQGVALLGTGQDLDTPLCAAPYQGVAPQDDDTSLGEAHLEDEAPKVENQVNTKGEDSVIRHSLQVASRFMDRLVGPGECFLEYLQRRHGVSIYRVRRKLHVKGLRNAVMACLEDLKAPLGEWRRREAAAVAAASESEKRYG